MRVRAIALVAVTLVASLGGGPTEVRSAPDILYPPINTDTFSRPAPRSGSPTPDDTEAWTLRPFPLTPRPRLVGAVTYPLAVPYTPEDNLYRLEVQRITLRGGRVPRFLQMTLQINCGRDLALVEALNDNQGGPLLDVLESLFGPLSFEDICRPSQKNDLRDAMVILFNQRLGTHSIRDIYYHTFVVY